MTNTNGSSDYEGITLDSVQEQEKDDEVDVFSCTLPESLTLPTFNFDLSALSIFQEEKQEELVEQQRVKEKERKEKPVPATITKNKASRSSQLKQLEKSLEKDFSFRSCNEQFDGFSHSSYFKSRSEPLDNVSFGLKKKANVENSFGVAKKHQKSSIFQELDSVFDTSCYDVSMFKKKKKDKSILESSVSSSFAFDPIFNSTKIHTPPRNFCDTQVEETPSKMANVSVDTNTTLNCSCKKQVAEPKAEPKASNANNDIKTTNVTTNLNTQGRELVITITLKLPEWTRDIFLIILTFFNGAI